MKLIHAESSFTGIGIKESLDSPVLAYARGVCLGCPICIYFPLPVTGFRGGYKQVGDSQGLPQCRKRKVAGIYVEGGRDEGIATNICLAIDQSETAQKRKSIKLVWQ